MIVTTPSYDAALALSPTFPKYKLMSYNLDTFNGGDTWAKIIQGTYSQTPFDLTGYVQSIDYTFDRLSVKLADDPSLLFHPDGGTLRAVIGPGRAIRLQEGFESLAVEHWLWTFSGTIEGTYAWSYERNTSVLVSFTVYNRASNQAWKRRNITSRSYTIGSDWSAMFMNVAKDTMALEDAEVAITQPWAVLFDKNTNQVVNYPPWDAMEQLLWGISAKPFFNGKGELDLFYITQDRVTQTLPDNTYVQRYDARDGGSETINKVILTYISNRLSRVDGEDQVLGTAIVTTGFFHRRQTLDVYYSDTRKIRSDNPRLVIQQSVNSGLIHVGAESMTKIDEFHSQILVVLSAWVAQLVIGLMAFYLIMTFLVFDIGYGIGTVSVSTPFGRFAQAAALVAILVIMSSIGTGQYDVRGNPYEMVYLEQQYIAMKSNLQFWQERELEIRNDFVSTEIQAKPLVTTQLHYEVMKAYPRSLVLRYDPRIEAGDIIQLSSSVRIYVDNVKRGITRGSAGPLIMNVEGWRTVL